MLNTNDLKKLSTIFSTKEDLDNKTNIIIKEIKTVIEMIGDIAVKTKDNEETINLQERRIDKLEDKVFSTG